MTSEEVLIKHVGSSDISVQHFLILSRLNDLMNCFNVDIIKLYISALDEARKLKFRYCVNLPFINCYKNVAMSLRLSDSVQCGKGLYFLVYVLYLCSFGYVRVLILSSYILLACKNKTDNSFHAWVIK